MDTEQLHPALIALERHTGLGPTFVARLLGMAYVTYAQVRCGSRELQLYHARHVESLMLHDEQTMQTLIERHARGNKKS